MSLAQNSKTGTPFSLAQSRALSEIFYLNPKLIKIHLNTMLMTNTPCAAPERGLMHSKCATNHAREGSSNFCGKKQVPEQSFLCLRFCLARYSSLGPWHATSARLELS